MKRRGKGLITFNYLYKHNRIKNEIPFSISNNLKLLISEYGAGKIDEFLYVDQILGRYKIDSLNLTLILFACEMIV